MPSQHGQSSLADYLHPISAVLNGELLGNSFESMLAVSRHVPWSAVSLFGFEWTLWEGPSGADLLFAANVSTGGRDILSGRHPLTGFAFDGESAEWHAIAEFCRRWAQSDNPLFYGADDVWFEFDVASGTSGKPAPSFFFGPRVG